MASTDSEKQDWADFDPGFDHGEVEIRASNIDGVFAASKIDAAGLVLPANVQGQIGNEDFDWSALNLGKTADVRIPRSPTLSHRFSR